MVKAIRIAYWINAVLILALFTLGVFRSLMEGADWRLITVLGGVFLFPFLEAPMLVISVWGLVKDRQRRSLYVITAPLMFGGLLFAFANRNTPFP